jgi:hypothetical protein
MEADKLIGAVCGDILGSTYEFGNLDKEIYLRLFSVQHLSIYGYYSFNNRLTLTLLCNRRKRNGANCLTYRTIGFASV